jgi:hypothetical protein
MEVRVLKDLGERGDDGLGIGKKKYPMRIVPQKLSFVKAKEGIFTQRTLRAQRSQRRGAGIDDRG